MKRTLLLLVIAFAAIVQAQAQGSPYDLNNDEQVNVGDVTTLVNAILGKEGKGADLNGDDAVNVGDVTKLVNVILGKEPMDDAVVLSATENADQWTDGTLLFSIADATAREVSVVGAVDKETLDKADIPEAVRIDNVRYAVTRIGDFAFKENSKLTEVNIPNSITTIQQGAFYFSPLKSVTIPASVNSIGRGAFAGCEGLESINVESGNKVYDSREDCNAIIKTEGNTLIAGCSKTAIPASVTTIGVGAFYGFPDLESIDLRSVKFIGEQAFAASGLTSITIPSTIQIIGKNAFINCANLKSISVDKDNKVFDSREDCNAIIETKSNTLVAGCSTTTIPFDVTTIGESAFYGCAELKVLSVPVSVKRIDKYAFMQCSSLQCITLPSDLEFIGSNAFNGCGTRNSFPVNVYVMRTEPAQYNCAEDAFNNTKANLYVPRYAKDAYKSAVPWNILNSIYEVNQNKSIVHEDNTFDYENIGQSVSKGLWSDGILLYSMTSDEEVKVYSVAVDRGSINAINIIIPEIVIINGKKYKVTCIGSSAFKYCTRMEQISISNYVTKIDNGAFNNCQALRYVILPSSIQEIDANAFQACIGLTYIRVWGSKPENYHCNSNAFSPSISNATLIVPAGSVDAYKAVAPWNKFGKIGPKLENKEDDKLTYIITNESAKQVAVEYVLHRSSLKEVNIPEVVMMFNNGIYSVTSIQEQVFSQCENLETVTIPKSVTSIGHGAFYNCKNLKSINIPDGITSISNATFSYCKSLTTIELPSSVTNIGNDAFFATGLTNIVLPNSLQIIGENAFCATPLNKVNIPHSVQYIKDYAFSNCTELTEITIGNGVISIGEYAFNGCTKLARVNAWRTDPALYGCHENAFGSGWVTIPYNLVVPPGYTAAYKAVSPWNKFKAIYGAL